MSNLTVEELRTFIATELADSALQLLIDAAEEQLANVPSGEISEQYRGGSRVIILRRPAESISSIREANAGADLDDGDPDPATAEYQLQPDGRSIYRIDPGLTYYRYWWGPVTIVSTPRALASLRKVATVQLVKGAIANNPGILGMTEGNWTIQFENGSTWSEAIDDGLAALDPPWAFS